MQSTDLRYIGLAGHVGTWWKMTEWWLPASELEATIPNLDTPASGGLD